MICTNDLLEWPAQYLYIISYCIIYFYVYTNIFIYTYIYKSYYIRIYLTAYLHIIVTNTKTWKCIVNGHSNCSFETLIRSSLSTKPPRPRAASVRTASTLAARRLRRRLGGFERLVRMTASNDQFECPFVDI